VAASARPRAPGNGVLRTSRGPTREPTPSKAPKRCTPSTPVKARNAFGVCNSVSTDDASWMTASAIAAISIGPPSADATIHRTTNQDAPGAVAAAVVRAVPHTINSTGSRGMTPSSLPPMETGTWWTPSHRLAIAPDAPVMSLFAISSCNNTRAAMTTNAMTDGPNATLSRSRA